MCGTEQCRAGNSPCTGEGTIVSSKSEQKRQAALRGTPLSRARAETGPMQFGEDWPGVFISGDSAFRIAMNLERALLLIDEGSGLGAAPRTTISSLVELLRSCIVTGKKDIEAPPQTQRALLLE